MDEPDNVGFEDADNDTITTFHRQGNGWLKVVMKTRGGTPLGVTEVHATDLIECLRQLTTAPDVVAIQGKLHTVEEWDCTDPPGSWNENVGSWTLYARPFAPKED